MRWENYHRRPHITALAKYANVLCVQPPMTLDRFISDPALAFKWLFVQKKLRKEMESLHIYAPFAFFSYGISHLLKFPKTLNRVIVAGAMKRILQKLGIKEYVMFIFMPQQDYLLNLLMPTLLCYEVTDAYGQYCGSSCFSNGEIRKSEARILQKADLVFASSRNLHESKKKENACCYFVPNAADVQRFMKALGEDVVIPEDIKRIKGPRIGLIGNINLNIDFGLLKLMAAACPDWSIVVIGAIVDKKNVRKNREYISTTKMKNIHYLGWRNYELLPDYLKALDVCLLPYVDNEYVRHVYPNKLHQYLAAGKPIVSSDMPEVRPYSDVVRIAQGHEDFIRLVVAALNEKSTDSIEKRVAVAQKNSVEVRAMEKIRIIKSHLRKEDKS
jgi:glycosyltransferase involved in cell wall biosynthesis